jgi:hypothetical protein
MLREFHHEHAGLLFANRDHKLISVPSASSPNFANLSGSRTDLFFDSNACALKVAPCCFILRNWGNTPIGRTGRCFIRNGWPVIPCFVVSTKDGRVFRSEGFHLAIHHGTQKRTDLSIESWIVGDEKIFTDYVYATSDCSRQNGIKTNASAFRHPSRGWNDDAVR